MAFSPFRDVFLCAELPISFDGSFGVRHAADVLLHCLTSVSCEYAVVMLLWCGKSALVLCSRLQVEVVCFPKAVVFSLLHLALLIAVHHLMR
jgi:hypothetical protein